MNAIAYSVPPSLRAHVAALETQMARKRRAGQVTLNFDMWDRWGAAHASPEQRADMEAECAAATRERTEAVQIVTDLVQQLRTEAPAAIDAWVDAHDAFLASFIAECAKKPDDTTADTAKFVAEGERAAWAEVRRGERAFVDENFYYVSIDAERYRALFGVEP